MCLYPKLIPNPKYKKTKKNEGNIPTYTDKRVLQVPIGCQKCMECRKQKSREWEVRLYEDIKHNTNGKFVTFTFSEEQLEKLNKEVNYKYEGYDRDNAIATRAVALFLKRWEKEHKKSLRHWLVTELGQESTERIHLHGIIWTDQPKSEVLKHWQYGNMGYELTWQQEENYVNGASIGYLVKYINKADEKHPNYKQIVLTSPGIGNKYIGTRSNKDNKYKPNGKTNETYRTNNGTKRAMPIYYRNKTYTEEEREKLWLEKLDKQERWINGKRVSIKNGDGLYLKLLKEEQERNNALGYGNDSKNWQQYEYEKQLRNLKIQERQNKLKEKQNKVNPPQDPRQSSGEIKIIKEKKEKNNKINNNNNNKYKVFMEMAKDMKAIPPEYLGRKKAITAKYTNNQRTGIASQSLTGG